MMDFKHLSFSLLAACALMAAGCTTRTDSNPPRTATEEMLISTAADRAADKLAVSLPRNSKVFIDTANFEGTDSKYAVGAIRTAMLKQGISLKDDRAKADVIIEARSGALSTDRDSLLVGIPGFNIPVPLASGTLPFPELALYKNDQQKGVAKFAITGYDARSGDLIEAQDPQYGFSHNDRKTALFFFSWTDSDAVPKEEK